MLMVRFWNTEYFLIFIGNEVFDRKLKINDML